MTNIEQSGSYSDFSLYPNPNDGQFFIDLKSEYQNVEVTVKDIAGRIITRNQHSSVSAIPMKIDVSTGIYFVKIQADGVSDVFKVIKY